MKQDEALELIRNGESSKVEALREGLVNAVCHRDYAISGSAIRLTARQRDLTHAEAL